MILAKRLMMCLPKAGWGEWILNLSTTVNTNGIAHYTAYKTNQREYYDSYANLDLTAAIVRSLHDTDMQQWQAVKDACNELTGVTDWVFDSANNRINYIKPFNEVDIVDPSDAVGYSHLALNGVIYKTVKGACMAYAPSAVNFYITGQNCQAWSQGNTSLIAAVGLTKTPNPDYDPNAGQPIAYTSYLNIALKIIANTASSNQGTALLAEAYLENVAKSIFAVDESKQFVKLEDLTEQFELNKVLRV